MTEDYESHHHFEAADHPSAGELAAYVDGVATPDERGRIETHLSTCADCREAFVIVRGARGSGSSRLRWLAGAAATAAAIALLILMPSMLQNGSEPILRGSGSTDSAEGSTSRITVVAPGTTVDVSSGDLRFVWRSAGPDAQYRLTITTTAGDAVAAITTEDTVIASLGNVELAPGTEYYWWVEALRADRAAAESGLQHFATKP